MEPRKILPDVRQRRIRVEQPADGVTLQGNQSVAAQMPGITRSALNTRVNHPREDA